MSNCLFRHLNSRDQLTPRKTLFYGLSFENGSSLVLRKNGKHSILSLDCSWRLEVIFVLFTVLNTFLSLILFISPNGIIPIQETILNCPSKVREIDLLPYDSYCITVRPSRLSRWYWHAGDKQNHICQIATHQLIFETALIGPTPSDVAAKVLRENTREVVAAGLVAAKITLIMRFDDGTSRAFIFCKISSSCPI